MVMVVTAQAAPGRRPTPAGPAYRVAGLRRRHRPQTLRPTQVPTGMTRAMPVSDGALPPGRRGCHTYHRDGGELLSHRTAWVGSASFKAVIAAPGVLGHGHCGHKATSGVCLNLPHDGRPRLEGNGNPGPGAKPFSP